ncbi:MAG: hypothetical protein FJ294_14320 [Planctomycetes bacterium]|nr:hypothetical protein [Planctomycetota bacterium]
MTVHDDPQPPWVGRLSAVRWWLLLGFIALAVRLLWVVAMRDRLPRFDEVFYLGHAEALADGRGYVDPQGREAAYWPPGFPALLAVAYRVFGHAEVVGVFVQGALGIASCFLISFIGTRMYGAGVGRLAAVGLALYPTHVFYTTLQLTEPLFAFLLLVATALVAKPSRAVGAAFGGAVLGLATLVRPSGVLFPFSLLVARPRTLWGSRAGRACAVVVVAASLVVITPWVLRTHRETGNWTVSTTGGHNFWMGNHPGAFGGYRYPPAINSELLVNGEMDYGRGFGLGVAAIAEAPL